MAAPAKVPRRQQILEALASELEVHPGARITTARLAHVVGISEAALYRHFPSKTKMFEALIEFAEEAVFGHSNRILGEHPSCRKRCELMLRLLLVFAERNPGVTRVLMGDALVGESERLRERGAQFFSRCETQLKQVLREGAQRRESPREPSAAVIASLLMALIEGRLNQFIRSTFTRSPLEGWDAQWTLLSRVVFGDAE